MNAHTIQKIAVGLLLGSVFGVTSNTVLAAPAQSPMSTGITRVKPNVMLVIDKSGSMDAELTTETAAITPNDAPANFSYTCGGRYVNTGSTSATPAPAATNMTIKSNIPRFCYKNTVCTSTSKNLIKFGTADQCFDSLKYYTVAGLTGTFTGSQLNWYFSTGTFTNSISAAKSPPSTRMEVAIKAGQDLVKSLAEKATTDKAKVRMGLATYNTNADRGRILVEIDDLKADTDPAVVSTTEQVDKLQTAIGKLTAGGSTPLATTLSDIGRYFTTSGKAGAIVQPTDARLLLNTSSTKKTITQVFGSNNIENFSIVKSPPIQNYCQQSAVILISDGLPNSDRDVTSEIRNYTGDCKATAPKVCDSTSDWNKILPGVTGVTNPVPLKPTGIGCTADLGWNNLACKNGTKAGRLYERYGSDYLDDVAAALNDIDLRPDAPDTAGNAVTWTITNPKPKNTVQTYTIGIADPVLAGDSVLKDAAIKGGGLFAYAGDAAALNKALEDMMGKIQENIGSFSAIVANSSELGANSALFQAKYDSANWSGDFLALPLDSSADLTNSVWNAGEQIPAWDSRSIYTYNSDTHLGVSFVCANLSATQKAALGVANCATASDKGLWLVDYLRGDYSHEAIDEVHQSFYSTAAPDPRKTTAAVDRIFRNRTRFYKNPVLNIDGTVKYAANTLAAPDPWLLGDIVNSDAAYVSNETFGYDTKAGMTSTEKDTYAAFVKSKDSWKKMAYIGANDGMLHGFNACIPSATCTTAEAGAEVFSYIPNSVYGGFKNLSSPSYSHQYFVDGSPRVGDAYFDSAWHTVLIGTTGAGGKGVFALDISNPGTINPVLWEVSDTDSPLASDRTTDTVALRGFANNLGYTLPQPSIAKTHNGVTPWAAIVANGYGSTNGRAVLYIIDIQTGKIIKAIDTGAGSSTQPNGLSTPFAADIDADGVVDAVYAGDLLGNMWKFDLSSTDPANWKVAYTTTAATPVPAPLFTACLDNTSLTSCNDSRQPITNKPQVGRTKAPQTGGLMVYFGTGKYFDVEDNDAATAQTQSFYGIWDECPTPNTAACSTTAVAPSVTTVAPSVAKSALAEQSIETEVLTTDTVPANRTTSSNSVNYPTQKGWYINFVDVNSTTDPKDNRGERIVNASLLRGGRIIFVTLIPDPPDDGQDACAGGSTSTSWLMALDAVTGGTPTTPVFIGIAGQTTIITGVQPSKGSSKTPAIMTNPNGSTKVWTGDSTAGKPVGTEISDTPETKSGIGRQSWREIIDLNQE